MRRNTSRTAGTRIRALSSGASTRAELRTLMSILAACLTLGVISACANARQPVPAWINVALWIAVATVGLVTVVLLWPTRW
ncbi:hypothetical protein [Rhodococcoides yunnanense]|uniref:hypothetical protein n=1 Tax=Rhodococcoides yunnanense TaxID=278209 RepID=UPI0022B0F67A|nr:hypothetical protein [Rhodococcus yunnanensis]MCZ4277402.1 hypothetical protein [Rhodococcus yunnanensis]